MIRSAMLIESEIAAANLGEGGPPFQSANRRADKIDAAIRRTRLRASSISRKISYSPYFRLPVNVAPQSCSSLRFVFRPGRHQQLTRRQIALPLNRACPFRSERANLQWAKNGLLSRCTLPGVSFLMPIVGKTGLHRLLVSRANFSCAEEACRLVWQSEFVTEASGLVLCEYVADRAPLFYRRLEHIVDDLKAGLFLTAFKDTLARLPSAESFQESHFGEIIAGLFAEDVLGLRRLYSKLSLLTAENSNAFKMDLLLCNPKVQPIEFILGEVKSSTKSAADGMPPGHHKSCFASLFDSFKKYESGDLTFDLTAARDRLDSLPKEEADRIHAALLPYAERTVKYAGFVVIDTSTRDDAETRVLATRKSVKEFDVELICIESLKTTVDGTYARLSEGKK